MSNENTWLTGSHHGLADIRHSSLKTEIGNVCLTNPAILIGTTDKETVDYTAFDYTIGGRVYTQATGTTAIFAVLDYYGTTPVQAADTTCFYVFLVNAAGTEYVVKGKDDETTDLPGFPPDLYACFGIVKVVTVAVTFTPATTEFDASGVTSTFYDYIRCPAAAP